MEEHNPRKSWARLFVALLAFGIASLSSSMSAIGAEGTPLSQATASGPTLPRGYVDNSTCTSCHEVQVKSFRQTMMGHLMMGRPRDQQESLACQSCHGPGREHIRHPHKPAPGFLSFRETSFTEIKIENERCLECHQNSERVFWQASTHALRNVRCVDCHAVMCPVTVTEQASAQIRKSPLSTTFVNPFVVTRNETQVCMRCHLDKKMEINLSSHMPLREGLMVCSDCHNPHGGPYPKQLRAATVNEVCFRCHAEKRGPFLWMHAPVAMNCLNCHLPHGSINLHMLVLRPPMLCQRCHIGTHHPAQFQPGGTRYVFGQSCTNSHSQIHGSNSPGGRVFTR
jgi:predicted CXXCH cytochrome family protein